MKQLLLLLIGVSGYLLDCSCKAKHNTVSPTNNLIPASTFAKGADVSWLTEMEASGIKFYDSTGVSADCLQVLKSEGINAVRLRVWVNPSNGYCDSADVLTKATRAKALGYSVMIDFHYSDSWADPGQQNKPAAWSGLGLSDLSKAVYQHTYNVLTLLKANNITPLWVQIGNEVNNGMLWENGKASDSMANFANLIASGYTAVKAVDSGIKVVIHLANGYDNTTFRWMFDGIKANGAKWDVIGMSLYPTLTNWETLDSECLVNMNDVIARYNCQVMLCEVGFEEDSPSVAKQFLTDILTKARSVKNNNCLGVFYWEPECYNSWQGYTLGAFNNGRPTIAMDAFKQ